LGDVVVAIDHDVRVVNGAYRGDRGILRTINTAKFSVTIEIASGSKRGKIVDGVAYEDICKIHA
jgi:DNA/RNA-binding protein KIN17